ncbi:raffinose/stachyose/melibiose transport system substrate-binding protein [Lachnospiraceae bacterium XBD2001]|nr:raffinose/stachyose/melibiose transport system substrate-binding protein [Lachnospiraceae bacterium XBD2001]
MKRRRILPLLMAMVLLFTGCGSAAADTGETAEDNGTIKLRVINAKAEVAEQMNALASAFNSSQSEIEVEIETLPSGVDIQSTLKGYYLADNMPDIISCEAAGFAKWEGLLADMSDQPWVSDTDAAYVDDTYGVLGFPFTTEAIGLAYNADVLAKAGIDPATLTSPSAYADAFATLDAQKDALGLTAVVGYCAEKENLYWSTGNHVFGAYLDSGLSRDDTTYIDLVGQGQLDPSRASNYASFIGMLNTYSDPALLTAGTYDDQVNGFASGKYAFVTQGSWIGSTLASSDLYKSAGSFQVGMAPYAFEDGMDTILTNPPSWWAVMKEGHVEAAEAFLAWCAGDSGQKIMVEDAGFISPFKSCKYVANDPFAPVLSEYLASGKTSAWHWMNVKEGLAENVIAPCFYDYAAGSTDAAGFVNALSSGLAQAYGAGGSAPTEAEGDEATEEETTEEAAADDTATEETTEEGGSDNE